MKNILVILLFLISCLLLLSEQTQAEVNGVSSKEIIIGTTTSLTGPFAALGNEISIIGAKIYFNHVNAQGGIHGRKIKYIVYDDGYKPSSAVSNAIKLLDKDKAFLLFCTFGTPTNLALKPLIEKFKVPLFSPITLSPNMVRSYNKYIFYLFPDYQTQATKIVKYLVWKNKKRISIIYQKNWYGIAGLEGTKKALKDNRITLLQAIGVGPKQMDLSLPINILKSLKTDSVILYLGTSQAAFFLKKSKKYQWTPLFIAPSNLATNRFVQAADGSAEGTIVLSIVPNPKTSSLSGVKQYTKLLNKYFPNAKPNLYSLVGFTSAKVLVECLKRTGPELTREKYLQALQSISNYRTGITYPITFSIKNHLGFTCPSFNKVYKGEFVGVAGPCGGEG